MNRTPLLRPLRDNGATLYVFPSASEDIGLNIDSRTTGVALSHYALLNIPNVQYDAQGMAEQLQNYVMNFETLLLNQEKYNYKEYHTVSERVFWHWINKKILPDFLTPNQDNIYYMEPDENYTNNTRLVQCFGAIDAGNTLSSEFGMFNETYINIPTSYGNGPVLFKHVQDTGESNYIKGKIYNSTVTTLQGRDDGNLDTLKILENSSPEFDENQSYIASDAFEIVKDVYQIQQALNKKLDITSIILNTYDDINVDSKSQFKDTVYDLNSKPIEFNFNAILLYYSVYDQDDSTKAPYAINLFGIIFLDGPTNVSEDSYQYTGLTKRKSFSSFESGNFFGNSYSFRVNLKTLSVYDNTDSVIMDNTTMTSIYSNDFNDVINNLNKAIDVMNTNVQATAAIQDQYINILRYYNDQNTVIEDISTKVNGFINGSKTSSFNTNLLRTNEIRPLNVEDEGNMIRITLNRQLNDYIETDTYENTTYISPIIIANDFNNYNTPTVYKPLINPPETAEGEFVDSVGKIQDIIDNINIKYYTYSTDMFQKLELPETLLSSYGLSNVYKRFPDYAALENNKDASISYVNYDALILLLITYVQELRKDIELLKNNL